MLTSNVRLHPEKIKRQNKVPEEQVPIADDVDIDNELRRLDLKRTMLVEKEKQRKEIA